MKKTLLICMALTIILTGCSSDDEQLAKDTIVKTTIKKDDKAKAFKQSLEKKDTRDYSNAFGTDKK